MHLELVGKLLSPLVQGGPHELVVLLASGKYQGHLSFVLRLSQYLRGDLHEGG